MCLGRIWAGTIFDVYRLVMSKSRRPNGPSLDELIEETIQAGELELPVFPASAREVIKLCEMGETTHVDAKRLSDVIRRDASLAGHFLAVANSAVFSGGRAPLVSLQQALTRLGMTQTKQIAMVVVCKTKAFVIPNRPERAAEILAHALNTALYAQEIARTRRLNVEEAFLAGLLHDIGVPAVYHVIADLSKKHGPFDEEEVERVSAQFHERVGGMIADKWTMPESVRSVIASHHITLDAASPNTTAIVQLADALAHGTTNIAEHPAMGILNLYAEELTRLTDKVGVAA